MHNDGSSLRERAEPEVSLLHDDRRDEAADLAGLVVTDGEADTQVAGGKVDVAMEVDAVGEDAGKQFRLDVAGEAFFEFANVAVVIVLDDGEALDYNSAILLDYQVEEVSTEEAPRLKAWRLNMPPVATMAARALGSRGGLKGGRSRSEAKVAAARENGKKGGRPKTRTL